MVDIKQDYLDEIISDRQRGASELARRCLEMASDIVWKGQATEVSLMKNEVFEFVQQLKAARPSMSPIQNLLQSWLNNLQSLPAMTLQEFRLEAISAADKIINQSIEAVSEATSHIKKLLKPGMKIITHSSSSTLLKLFRICKRMEDITILISESRPLNEGRKVAEQLNELGIHCQLFTDAQIGVFAAKSDIALVGVDAVLKDGSIVNKVGTYLLALAAAKSNVPFYAVYESFKQSKASRDELILEEMDVRELGYSPLPHVALANQYFDITPPELITGWVTEAGIKTKE